MSQVTKPRNTGSHLAYLQEMRDFGGAALTTGLTDDVVLNFLGEQRRLRVASANDAWHRNGPSSILTSGSKKRDLC